MSPSILGSSPSSTGAFSEASTIMTYEDDDDEKDYVCFKVLLLFKICIYLTGCTSTFCFSLLSEYSEYAYLNCE